MTDSNIKNLYEKGRNPKLDIKYAQYEKVNLFAGRAVDEALSDMEGNTLVRLWMKQRKSPWRMNFQEVTDFVAYADKILTWRRKSRRERTRVRVERLRKRLREAGESGDAKALRKIKKIKKAAAVRSTDYRKRKRKKKSLKK